MKKCPFCGTDIEDNARFCLYCMQSLVEKEQILPYKKKKPQWLLIIAAIVGVSLMIILLIGMSKNQDTNGNYIPSEGQHIQTTPSSDPTDAQHSPTSQPATQPSSQPPNSTTPDAPIPTVPDVTEPEVTEPTITGPGETESESTEPQVTEPEVTEPEVTEPEVTEPEATEPQVTEPEVTEPSTEPHEHSFTIENPIPKYLAVEANCSWPAAYVYSCSCGEGGFDTFYYGQALEHIVVTEPGRSPDCVNAGCTESSTCSLCGAIFKAGRTLPPLGHTFQLGNSSGCVTCGAERTVNIVSPSFPVETLDLQFNDGSYSVQQKSNGTWIYFTFSCTNISSGTLMNASPNIYLEGYGFLQCGTQRFEPYQSGTFYAEVQINDMNCTLDLDFWDIW